ncbi:unnamed protein product [Protopolystoma xenopodis]|uniref:Uncharacterized protein n=1 Tax=Protopolystoma xenopodis TaxID=117903 RepID=A0A448X4D5_9PLAT|nr:unnamed protein product [Protopolystoma xenopodis]
MLQFHQSSPSGRLNWFTLPGAVQALCLLERRILRLADCHQHNGSHSTGSHCCRIVSLPSAIARLRGRASCEQVRF